MGFFDTEKNTYGFTFDFAKVGFAAGIYPTGQVIKNKAFLENISANFDQDLTLFAGNIQMFCNGLLCYSVGMPSAISPFQNASTFPFFDYINNPNNAEIMLQIGVGGITGGASLTMFCNIEVTNRDI